jgi:hypothetical protein
LKGSRLSSMVILDILGGLGPCICT